MEEVVSEVSREPVLLSVARSGALWPDTLTPVPTLKTGVVPVGRGVAPRSCSPGTPTGPEGTQVRADTKVSIARTAESGDQHWPQDRRSTNIGLLKKREQCFQTVRPKHRIRQQTHGSTQYKQVSHLCSMRIINSTFVRILILCLLMHLSGGNELFQTKNTVYINSHKVCGI